MGIAAAAVTASDQRRPALVLQAQLMLSRSDYDAAQKLLIEFLISLNMQAEASMTLTLRLALFLIRLQIKQNPD